MKHRVSLALIFCTFGFVFSLTAQPQTGESMYKASCAQCHDEGVGRAPKRDTFHDMSPERVLAAMETGEMVTMGMRWPAEGRRAIAEFVTGKAFGTSLTTEPGKEAMCTSNTFAMSGTAWNGWGRK